MLRIGLRYSENGCCSRVLVAESFYRFLSTKTGRKLQDKVALITGAASGIGKATATEFINNGAKVILADIQQQIGQETAKELGPNATFIMCDVSNESDVSRAVDFAVSEHNQLDIMYNNAGIIGSNPPNIVDLDLALFDKDMSTNVRGAMAGIKHAALVMIPRGSGSILCTSSVSGVIGGMGTHAYSVSKFAVIGMVKSLASELCKFGIRINCISPFAIPTPIAMKHLSKIYAHLDAHKVEEIVNNLGVLKGAICEASDIANAALYLASDDAKYVSGHNLIVDGGFTSFKNLDFPAPDQVQ
ncbi:PREDICTED: short-chain dehydrogenase reductase 3a-like isoform X3 [Lupinus angustifolius]|uniref:short-chain dehydrogenase reductase 3a-like isoform X3 n=1 Tax=Lupinus angustifolius TaxID=3871 RepID=UPI00092F7582|nr:PREDICTED: short-chain dehydrogenase reductase 3a-like isoform X3 [Lupinus angustifolius]